MVYATIYMRMDIHNMPGSNITASWQQFLANVLSWWLAIKKNHVPYCMARTKQL